MKTDFGINFGFLEELKIDPIKAEHVPKMPIKKPLAKPYFLKFVYQNLAKFSQVLSHLVNIK